MRAQGKWPVCGAGSVQALVLLAMAAAGPAAQAADSPAAAVTRSAIAISTPPPGFFDADPEVARDADGDGVAAWARIDEATEEEGTIMAQRFDALGKPVGAPITVGPDDNLDVDMAPGGSFVVTYGPDAGSETTVAFRRYSASGVLIGTEQRVDQSDRIKGLPVISMNASGAFVIAWLQGSGKDESPESFQFLDIMARRYNANGVALGPEFVVDATPGSGFTFDHDVDMADDGRFVVTYPRCAAFDIVADEASGCDIAFRRFNASGVAQGGEVTVNTTLSGEQIDPQVAMVPRGPLAGSFKVVWGGRGITRGGGPLDPDGVYERDFAADGTPADAAEVPLSPAPNEPPARFQFEPEVATDGFGNTIVTWRSFSNANGDNGQSYLQLCEAPAVVTDPQVCYYSSNGSGTGNVPFFVTPLAVAMDADGDPMLVTERNGVISVLPLAGIEDVGLALDLSSSPNPVQQGQTVTYTATVLNQHAASAATGVGVATGVQLRLDGAGNIDFTSASGSGWACADDSSFSGRIGCNLAGPLAPGASSTVSVSAQVLAGGNFSVPGAAFGAQFDSDTGGDDEQSVNTTVTVPPPPVANFVGALLTVDEAAGNQMLTVQLSRAATSAVSVPLSFAGGTPDADYLLPQGTTVFIAAGQSSGSLPVLILEDALDEPVEVITVTMGTPTGASLGTKKIFRVRTTDNDAAPVMSVSLADQVLSEGGVGEFDIVLSTASGQSVSATLSLAGTAVSGDDYLALPATVSFAPGVVSRRIRVRTVEDAVVEPNEVARVVLSMLRNATLGTPSAYRLTIQNDD